MSQTREERISFYLGLITGAVGMFLGMGIVGPYLFG